MMYKLMIVDDEPEIRAHIKSMIQWEKLNLLLVGEVGDSDSALENFYLFRPHVVIMDICITGMDGISLTQEFLHQDPSLKVIFISSHQDFSYAQKVLSMGASYYLTKPIIAEELNDSLNHVLNELSFKKEESQRIIAARQVIEKNRDLLQRWVIDELINGDITDTPEQVGQQFALLGMNLQGKKHVVAIISVQSCGMAQLDGEFQMAAVKQYIDITFNKNGYEIYSYFDDVKNIKCLISQKDDISNEEFERIFIALSDEINSLLELDIHVGIGLFAENITGISMSAKQAEIALQNASNMSGDSVVSFLNLEKIQTMVSNGCSSYNKKHLTSLLDCIRNGETEMLSNQISFLLNQLVSENDRHEFSMDLLSEVSRICTAAGIDPWKLIDYPVVLKQLFISSPSDFGDVIFFLCDRVNSMLRQKNMDVNSHLIRKAKAFIEENYGDKSLSLEQVSNHIGLSKAYFCALFHKVEGITFKSYLNTIRIEHAKSILITTDKKIYEISCDVGCSDSAYFNRLFKRMTGKSPLQYRNNSIS